MRWTPTLLFALTFACAGAGPGMAHNGEEPACTKRYCLEVTDARGRQLPTYRYRGGTYVLGAEGQRYRLRVRNRTGRRVEAVVSVDGRDAIDGRKASWKKRGYIVEPWGEVTVDGFRLDLSSVATFRFSKVKDSYAARMGDARNVGVIGVAIFPERRPRRRPRPVQPPPYYRPWYGSRDKDSSAPGDELAEAHGRAGGESSAGAPRPDSYDAAPEAEAPAAKSKSESASGSLSTKRSRRPARRESRPGLGTEFGERRSSAVVETRFVRANRKHPSHMLVARYNDGPGLVALGIDLERWPHDRDLRLRESASPFAESRPRGGFSSPPAGWR